MKTQGTGREKTEREKTEREKTEREKTEKKAPEFLRHPIPPLFDRCSRILILGSFPSPKSREAAFFYGHPQNRFWRVMAEVLEWRGAGSPEKDGPGSGAGSAVYVPRTVPEKREMLLTCGVALWDTIASCEIVGASDSTITNVTPNDLSVILSQAHIRRIYCNGAKSHGLYMKYIFPVTGREAVKLPSTSPANAAASVAKLVEAWSCIREELEEL